MSSLSSVVWWGLINVLPFVRSQSLEGTRFCPNCGHKLDAPVASTPIAAAPPPPVPQRLPQKRNKKWIVLVAFGFFAIVGLIVIGAHHSEHPSNAANVKDPSNTDNATSKGYELTAKESALLDNMATEEANVLGKGGETLIFQSLLRVSAQDVAKAYDENQVAADQAYYQKQLLVTGAVASINSGLANSPYIVFQGTNEFEGPQASFGGDILSALTSSPTDPSDVDKRIATLKKRQRISLVCMGAGSVAGTATFSDCVFADVYGAAAAHKINESVRNVLAGREKPSKDSTALAVATLALARILPDNSPCFSRLDSSKCSPDMAKVKATSNPAALQQTVENVVKELQGKGIDLSKELKQ